MDNTTQQPQKKTSEELMKELGDLNITAQQVITEIHRDDEKKAANKQADELRQMIQKESQKSAETVNPPPVDPTPPAQPSANTAGLFNTRKSIGVRIGS